MNARSFWRSRRASISDEDEAVRHALLRLGGRLIELRCGQPTADPELPLVRFLDDLLDTLWHQSVVDISPYYSYHDDPQAERLRLHRRLAEAWHPAETSRMAERLAMLETLYAQAADPVWDTARVAQWLVLLRDTAGFRDRELLQPLWLVPKLAACHPHPRWFAAAGDADGDAHATLWRQLTVHSYGLAASGPETVRLVLRRTHDHVASLATDPRIYPQAGQRLLAFSATAYFILAMAHAELHARHPEDGAHYDQIRQALSALVDALCARRDQWLRGLSATKTR